MKLAFCLFKYYPYGGLERDFIRIIEVCQQRGYIIDVYTGSWDGVVPEGLKVILVPSRGLTNHGRCAAFVKNLSNFKLNEYDAIVGFNRMPGLDVYYAADICYEYDIRQRHGWWYRLTKHYKVYSAFERAIFQPEAKTHIMYLAESVKQRYIEIYHTPQQRFHLLSPGIALNFKAPENSAQIRYQIRKANKIDEQQRLVLQVGSDYQRKGVDRSLLAIASLHQNVRDNTLLWVVGKGKARPFQRQAKRFGINVKFLGTTDKVPELLLAADLLLHPAYREAAGMVLVEAIAAGLPVLTTDTCGFAYHVKQAQAGLIVPSPFKQETLNAFLLDMLISEKRQAWKNNALAYGKTEDLYDRTRAADIIEKRDIF